MYGYIYTFLLSFATTLFCLQWYQSAHYPILLPLNLALIVVITTIAIVKKHPILHYLQFGLIGSLIALISVSHTTHTQTPATLDYYATEQFIELSGVITAEPDHRPLQSKYTIAAQSITVHGTTKPVQGKVLFTDRRQWPIFEYGDTVTVRGVLQTPGLINGTFAYDNYLSRYDIYSVMYSGGINKVATPITWYHVPLRTMFSIKQNFEAQINKIFPEPHASFMAGLLTGSRKGIPQQVLDDFQVTGLTHIIAISGYNITLIISLVVGLLFWLPRKHQLLPACIAIVGFTLFVGASAAVVRACIMGLLGLLALHTNSVNSARVTVLWTLFFMTVWNPKYLWYDAGFQLSFLAVLGLLECAPFLEPFCKRLPKTLAIRESIQMTLAAQIAAAPLIVLLFNNFSTVAPLANVLIAPFIPLAMLFGTIGVVSSYVFFPLGQAIAYLAWACLQYVIYIAQWLGQVPYASLQTQVSHWQIALLYYAGIVCIVLWYQNTFGKSKHTV